MPRPRKCRMVDAKPGVWLFKPQGIPARLLDEVYLPIEGYEALRLADLEGLRQDEAAAKMKVSRQTFGRILAEPAGRWRMPSSMGWRCASKAATTACGTTN